MRRWSESAPGEGDAGERSWEIVRRAYEERLPAPRAHRRRPFVLVAIAAAALAAAFSPPGLAVWGSLRDAVRGEQNAKPALFSLPTPHSRLLVNSAEGAWVVESDGSKRLLPGYRDASWSPHGLYIAAIHGDELRALEPDGDVHWSLARRGLRDPRWSFDGYRIAYFAGRSLRIVNGDGTGDHLLTRNVRPGVSAWQPARHVLAYVNRRGDVQIDNVDKHNRRSTVRSSAPRQLEWASDGLRFLAVERDRTTVFWQRGPRIGGLERGPARVTAASISPNGKHYAFVETDGTRSSLWLTGVLGGPTVRVFSGAGTFANVRWSPDGRWLLLDWPSADQWLFIRTPVKKLVAVSNIRANFGPAAHVVGWCCP
jgi:dipeptidyl aminopeptidase/acylaminoacyl peptidase